VPKRVAIVQSNYLPWKGYFDLIASVDAFVLLDSAQFTRRDWRNRNRIKTERGLSWLSVPVTTRGRFAQSVRATRVSDRSWPERHWRKIEAAYRGAGHFADYGPMIAGALREADAENLCEVNARLLRKVCAWLDIDTPLVSDEAFADGGEASERLLRICLGLGAGTYVSGPRAKAYLDVELFSNAGVQVEWFSYEGFPRYAQLHGDFVHEVSIVDLLLNEGPGARCFLRSARGVAER
jgi:hypothetical protein